MFPYRECQDFFYNIRSSLHHLHQITHHLHHKGTDKCGKLDVAKCEKRRYEKNRGISADFINLSDFVLTKK